MLLLQKLANRLQSESQSYMIFGKIPHVLLEDYGFSTISLNPVTEKEVRVVIHQKNHHYQYQEEEEALEENHLPKA